MMRSFFTDPWANHMPRDKRCDCGVEISESQDACDDCRVDPCWWCDNDFVASALVPVAHKGKTIRVCSECAAEIKARRAA